MKYSDIRLHNTSNFPELNKDETIALSKKVSELRAKSHIKIDTCYLCGKPMNGSCNSHSLPQFILRQITDKGKIFTGTHFMAIHDKSKGISNALTFGIICKECDSTFFKEYENPSIIDGQLSNIAINEIAAKNYLRSIYKRINERGVFTQLLKERPGDYYLENKVMIANLDIQGYLKMLNKIIKHKSDRHFYVIDEFTLPFQAQLAFQDFVGISVGFDGIVNDIYNYDPSYEMEELGLCVFPYNGKTKVLVFCKNGSVRMRHFYKPFRKLSLDEKCYVINYLILLYSEDWCVSESFDESDLNQNTKKLIHQMTEVSIRLSHFLAATEKEIRSIQLEELKRVFAIQTSGDIYNFLKPANNN